MKLSELKTGEKGVIVRVSGHGGFRKRIIEMGFIKGKEVDVLLNAPLKDPVKYKVMGYEVKPGCNPIESGQPGFFECYEDVGAFPEVDLPLKTVYTRILTAFGAGLVPIL